MNIEKRIKRHVLGKVRSFYVSTLPGIEYLCKNELASAGIPTENAEISNGGLEFLGRVHDCYLANLHLRTANRVLMRIHSFTATNFRQLEKHMSGIPWELYLHAGTPFDTNITSRHSRLFHSDAVAERIKGSILERWNLSTDDLPKNLDMTAFSQQIFVRSLNDRFTVSIDSSGNMLFKRGLKVHGGRAPIRETTAAAILAIAGYTADAPLIDPMCGTGTFSLEAAMIACHIPAGWYRNFAFMGWPCFKQTRWEHIRRNAKSRIAVPSRPMIFASDMNTNYCQSLEAVIRDNNFSKTISVREKNFFDLLPFEINGLSKQSKKGLVVLNPPYGRRLGTKSSSEKLFAEICGKLLKDFKGWKIALIAPDKHLIKQVPFKINAHPLFHGGLHLTLLTGRIR